MNKKYIFVGAALLLTGAFSYGGYFYWKNFRGAYVGIASVSKEIAKIINTTEMPLKLPMNFSISIFAKDLGDPRVMQWGPDGALLVSAPKLGKVIALFDNDNNGISEERVGVATGLNFPHGLAVRCKNKKEEKKFCQLAIAETDKVSLFDYDLANHTVLNREKLFDLPSNSDGHWTRTLLLLGEDLLTSVGSSCNVCRETDSKRASILSFNLKTGELKTFAKGLRNAVFMALHPSTGKIWATEMGRDFLGDDLPPDEINIIEEGKNYGWPVCYGKNAHDADFDQNTYIRNPCMEPFEIPSHIDLPAHSASLGIAFFPKEGWPEDYWHDVLVAYHGSWNRTKPTGYKIVRIKLDVEGNFLGTEDFITGWLSPEGVYGRPVDILIRPGGVILISDDKAGVIYRVIYKKTETDNDTLIQVSYPSSEMKIQSPLRVVGRARGNWFSEASFPVLLLDANGNKIAEHYAEAKSDWMTEDFVPYESVIEFKSPNTANGTVILKRNNPSGLAENDAEVKIPVVFKRLDNAGKITPSQEIAKQCFRGGCSGQLCATHDDTITTCEWREEYACYKEAICELLPSGACGWRQTLELVACLQKNNKK